jgi:glycosyltransferase involved in cell wall biosynthesis
MNNPKVSICITTFNRANELSLTLNSILVQTFQDFEIIISDDHSTDKTEEVCYEFIKKDPRIRYYKNSFNLKMPGNLNSVISKATGKYIANLHDGDIYRCDLIEKWNEALDKNPQAAFVFNDYSSKQSTFGNNDYAHGPIKSGVGQFEVAKHYFKTLTCCVWGTVMARKETYENYGPFNSKYGFISDVEMWLRICANEQFAYINEHLIHLIPREPNHNYYLPDWRHKYWDFLILKNALILYKDLLPNEVHHYTFNYKIRLVKEFLVTMLILLKHKSYKRVKEGFTIWRDSPYFLLKVCGSIFRFKSRPSWYVKDEYWNELIISK